jgi:serine/threonine protein kinase
MLFELATGVPPFYAPSLQALRKLILATEPIVYPPTMSSDLASFLSLLLVKNPQKRAGWDEILSHPFIKDFDASKHAESGMTIS